MKTYGLTWFTHRTRLTHRQLRLRDWYDLALLMGTAAVLPLASAMPSSALRVLIGLPIVLLAPGYTLLATLLVDRDDLDGITRFALSFGMSVAIIPILALVLDLTGWGIQPLPISVALASWIASCCVVALVRRWARNTAIDIYVPAMPTLPPWGQALKGRQQSRIAGLLLGIIVLTSLGLFWTIQPSEGLTEFYVLGAEGQAEEYPRTVTTHEQVTVKIGLLHQNQPSETFRVEGWATDLWQTGRRRRIAQMGPLIIKPDTQFEQDLSWSMPWVGDDQSIDLLLFVGDEPQPYRQLKLWIDVTEN